MQGVWVTLLFAFLLVPARLAATADFGAVNHVTGECAVFEDDDYLPLGWVPCGERCSDDIRRLCAGFGYELVERPLPWVELTVAAVTALILLRVWFKIVMQRRR